MLLGQIQPHTLTLHDIKLHRQFLSEKLPAEVSWTFIEILMD